MRTLYLFTTLLLIIIAGCKKNNDVPGIAGAWQVKYDLGNDHTILRQLSFDDQGRFNMKAVVINTASKQLLGFVGKAKGSYSTTSNQLAITYQQQYYKNDNNQEYVAEDKLVASSSNAVTVISQFSFSAKKDTLILTSNNCPPNANCLVGPITEKYFKAGVNAY